MRNYHLKYTIRYIICRASFKQLLCNTFLKIRNTTQQQKQNTQRRYVITNLMILFMFKYNFEKQKKETNKNSL